MLNPRLICGACLSGLLVVAPAQAAPGWLAPQDLSGTDAYEPDVTVDPAGTAVAAWQSVNTDAALHVAGGVWQLMPNIGAGQRGARIRVASDVAGNAVAVWMRFSDDGATYVIEGAARPAGGAWQAPQVLSVPGGTALNPQVAMDASGNAVAVWSRQQGGDFIAQAAMRPAGAGWQPPQDLSAVGGSASFPQVAIDRAGNAVAVWNRFNGTIVIIQAAVRPSGGSWQPPQDVSGGLDAYDPQVAVDDAGNAVAVWKRSNGMHNIVQAALRPLGGPWQLPQSLSAAGQNASEPQVAVNGAGNAVAVWWRSDGMDPIVQAATRPAGGPWQLPALDLSENGEPATEPQAALDPAGNAVVVWTRYNGSHYIVQGSARPAGGTWQSAKDLSTAGQTAGFPQVAVDSAGNAVAVWQRGAPPIVQAAAYDATAPELRNVRVPARGFVKQRLTFSVDPFDTWSLTGEPAWNFGDGKTASGKTVTHAFAKRGSYTVTVTQQDAVANSTSATRQVVLRIARCFGKAATRVGTNGPDRIVGTRRADVIVTLGGNDRVRGRGGKDRICGGKGRDRLAGGAGNDLLNGGPGKDICSQGGGRGRLVAC